LIVAIHQPNFLPWIGYFYKISQADTFVVYDDVQYTKNGYINRNRIKTPNGEQWLTLPVKQAGNFGQNILNTEILNADRVQKKIARTLEMNYKKCPYFVDYFEDLQNILAKGTSTLALLNLELINYCCRVLEIDTKIILSSSFLPSEKNSDSRLIEICNHLKATSYLSGKGGANYQSEEKFKNEGIELNYTEFTFPKYEQPWGDFLPNLSIVDTLFNCGSEASEFVK
jgi:hypothetical protein